MLHDQVTSPNILSPNFQEAIISYLLIIRSFILHTLFWKVVLGIAVLDIPNRIILANLPNTNHVSDQNKDLKENDHDDYSTQVSDHPTYNDYQFKGSKVKYPPLNICKNS